MTYIRSAEYGVDSDVATSDEAIQALDSANATYLVRELWSPRRYLCHGWADLQRLVPFLFDADDSDGREVTEHMFRKAVMGEDTEAEEKAVEISIRRINP